MESSISYSFRIYELEPQRLVAIRSVLVLELAIRPQGRETPLLEVRWHSAGTGYPDRTSA
jgi:hypothetical protein